MSTQLQAQKSAEPSWIDRLLKRDLPTHIKRIKERDAPTSEWLRTELHGTVLGLVGDGLAFAKDMAERFGPWLEGLTSHVEEHEERLQVVEAFIDALGGDTQLLPVDADDIAKLAAGTKWIVAELLKGENQTEQRKPSS